MRRSLDRLLMLPLLLAVFLLPLGTLPAVAGEDDAPHGRPTAKQLLDRILAGSEAERALAAQFLKQADPGSVLELFRLIRDTIEPPKREPEPPSLLERVRRMRERKPEQQIAMITLTTWILAIDAGKQGALLKEAGIGLDGGRALLDTKEASSLRRAVLKLPSSSVLTAPRVSILDGQRSDLSVLDQISYLSGYDVVRSAQREVANPQVGTLRDGLCLSLEARVVPKGRSVRVSMRATWAHVARPLAVCEAPVGSDGGSVKIQVPHTELTCRDVDIDMPAGATLLLQGPDRGPQGSRLLLLEANVQQVSPAFLEDTGVGLPKAPTPEAVKEVVNLEARVIDVPAAKASAFLDGDGGGEDVQLTSMDDREVAEFLRRVEADAAVKIVAAPRMTVYDGQKGNVHVTNEVSYVQDYEIENSNGRALGDPIIGIIEEGVILEVTPTFSEDRKYVTVEILGTWASVKRPIPDFKAQVGKSEVTIQIPELTVRRARATVRLPSGGSVLLRGPKIEGMKAERVVLLRSKVK